MRKILITGGAGFIGSALVRYIINETSDAVVVVDKLTYAGNLANLKDIEDRPNYTFVKADICDFDKMSELIRQYRVDGIIHLAAESHVDRSIKDPFTFARTNVMGTLSLLQAAKEDSRVLPDPEPSVVVSAYLASSVQYTLRAWALTGDYWDVYYALNESARRHLESAGLSMAFDRVDVRIVKD